MAIFVYGKRGIYNIAKANARTATNDCFNLLHPVLRAPKTPLTAKLE